MADTFKIRLKKLRLIKGVSQLEIAEIAGVERATISRYETGARNKPTLPVLEKLSDYFCVSIDYLTGNSDSPIPSFSNDYIINLFLQIPTSKRNKAISYLKYLITEGEDNGNN